MTRQEKIDRIYKVIAEDVYGEPLTEASARGYKPVMLGDVLKFILLLWKYRNKKVPVYKLVYDLRCHRFGSIIHRLRREGWSIATVYDGIKDGQQMYSYVLYI